MPQFAKQKQVLFLCYVLVTLLLPLKSYAESADELYAKGQQAFNQGDFSEAIKALKPAAYSFLTDKQINQYLDVTLQLSFAYQKLGLQQDAFAILKEALPIAQAHTDATHHLSILSQLGMQYIVVGQMERAQQALEDSVVLARQQNSPLLIAQTLNNLGNWHAIQRRYPSAIAAYQEAVKLAEQGNDETLMVHGLTNEIQVYVDSEDTQAATTALDIALTYTRKLPDTYEKTFSLLTLGRLAQTLQTSAKLPATLRLTAHDAYSEAMQLAEKLNNYRLLSYANGYLGELYASGQRQQEAMRLTRQAIFFAQQQSAPELLYRWQWQLGRLFKQRGELDEAVRAYQQAVTTVQPIRPVLNADYRRAVHSRQGVRLMYFELADLLLQQADQVANTKEQREKYLTSARDTVELLKEAELQDYFQDDCVTQVQSKAIDIYQLAAHTAILYPIMLPDRLALLLSSPAGISQVSVPVPSDKLEQEVNVFRSNLVTRTHRKFLIQAQQLHKWLIEPINAELTAQNIETLVIVPDGALRTIPLGALHDGNQFLIQRFAMAITPGVKLTDPQRFSVQNSTVLLNGLSQGVQNFSPLPSVPQELRRIQGLFNTSSVLQDNNFLIENVADRLKNTPYSIIHIASHGQFSADPQKTFLLTFDGKLTINRLEELLRLSEFREEPVELLTLSACQTAVGDDRAALGLAGIAIKAGARSALASLWFVDDEATSKLVVEFYRQLQTSNISKAKALQNAQVSLLSERIYQHPAYWAAFLLIGNWL